MLLYRCIPQMFYLSLEACALMHSDMLFQKFSSSKPRVEIALAASTVLSGRVVR